MSNTSTCKAALKADQSAPVAPCLEKVPPCEFECKLPRNHPMQEDLVMALAAALDAFQAWLIREDVPHHPDGCDCYFCDNLDHMYWFLSGHETLISGEIRRFAEHFEWARRHSRVWRDYEARNRSQSEEETTSCIVVSSPDVVKAC